MGRDHEEIYIYIYVYIHIYIYIYRERERERERSCFTENSNAHPPQGMKITFVNV
jgi:hypothetical protein